MRLIATRPAAAEMISAALAKGGCHVAFREHRSFSGPEGILPVVAGMNMRTLLLTEFNLVRKTVADLRAVVAKDQVGAWGEPSRIVVTNYEKAGLYLRFADPDEFQFLAMMEHGPENLRSAFALGRHFNAPTLLQVVRTRGETATRPDVTLLRYEDGRIERTDAAEAEASAA